MRTSRGIRKNDGAPCVPTYGKGCRRRKEEGENEDRRKVPGHKSSIHSRLGIKGVLYDAVVYGRGFYLIALPPVRISQ